MNPFQKNPFMNNKNSTNVYNQDFQEKNKLERIKMDMNKIKQFKPIEKQEEQRPQMTVSEKIEALRNINDR